MPSRAHLTIYGHLGHPPSFKTVGDAQLVEVSVAVSHWDGKAKEEITTWFRVTGWRNVAQRVAKLVDKGLGKGSLVLCMGELRPRTFEDRGGAERMSLDITANVIDWLQSSADHPDNQGSRRPQEPQQEREGGEEDVPF